MYIIFTFINNGSYLLSVYFINILYQYIYCNNIFVSQYIFKNIARKIIAFYIYKNP